MLEHKTEFQHKYMKRKTNNLVLQAVKLKSNRKIFNTEIVNKYVINKCELFFL